MLFSGATLWKLVRFGGAVLLTSMLLIFLVVMRIVEAGRNPEREIRVLDSIEEVALPAPPPPPLFEPTKPPPPPPSGLPRLEIQLDDVAPPIKAVVDRQLDLTMRTADFELEIEAAPAPELVVVSSRPRPKSNSPPTPVKPGPSARVRTTFSAGELDAMPRLTNRPTATYPSSQLRKGVRKGRVVLEVAINTSGRVSVRRVISSTHADFSTMARSFASRARFTVPKKNGTPVTAIYQWPLTLQP